MKHQPAHLEKVWHSFIISAITNTEAYIEKMRPVEADLRVEVSFPSEFQTIMWAGPEDFHIFTQATIELAECGSDAVFGRC